MVDLLDQEKSKQKDQKVIGVYVHIPFCNRICNYCDFAKIYYNSLIVDNYLIALEKEIINNYQGEAIDTLYIGGGTPSCLNHQQLKKLFEILNIFNRQKLKEFTIECNIEDLTKEKLVIFKNHGINRISIGIQTFNQKILRYLGRKSFHDIDVKLKLVKKYFDNINVDLIYGINNQSLADLNYDLDKIISFDIPHISTYSLIIEPHTKFMINNHLPIDDELDFKMYKLIRSKLKKYNYKQYEISNFAKANYQSKHNLKYWGNDEYYGFGLGSHGYINNIRYENTRSINHYLDLKYGLKSYKLMLKEKIENEFILGFRKIKGINKQDFFKRYNYDIKKFSVIAKHLKLNNILDKKGFLYINPKYLYTMNNILVDFIGGIDEREINSY